MAYSPSRMRHTSHQSVNTTDATQTTLKTIPVKLGSVVRIWVECTAIRTGGSSGSVYDSAGYVVTATVKNNNNATIVGGVTMVSASEDQVAWDCTITVSGGNALVSVTGAANNNITWNAMVRVIENA